MEQHTRKDEPKSSEKLATRQPYIIEISEAISDATVRNIEKFLRDEAASQERWNSITFQIERGLYTCIPDDNSYDALMLLNAIHDVIRQENK